MRLVPIKKSYVRARDGAQLFCAWSDGPADTRIVLVHSLAMDHAFWSPVVGELAGVASIVAMDCRGHGKSDKPRGRYSVEQFADDVADVVDAARWSKAIVAGASMGGCVCLAFAARHAQRCSGLGLFDTTAWYGPQALAQWAERADKALVQGLDSLVDFQKTRWFGDRFRAERSDVVNESVAVFLRNDPVAYAETCRMLGACDLRAVLGDVRVPTRIAVGEEDYATPLAMAESLHIGIPGSTLTVIQEGRHLTPLERPVLIAGELKQLIKTRVQ